MLFQSVVLKDICCYYATLGKEQDKKSMKIFITVLPVSNNLISNTEDILKLNSKPRVDKNVITAILDGRKYFWRVSPNGF